MQFRETIAQIMYILKTFLTSLKLAQL